MERNTSSGLHTFFNAKAATGTGTTMDVRAYKHIVVGIATDGGGTAALTVKCQGSIGDSIAAPGTAPDFGSAQSVSNHWDYIGMYDYQNAAIVAGDTGFVVASADDVRLFLVNVDGLEYINFTVTARSAGSVSVFGKAYTNL